KLGRKLQADNPLERELRCQQECPAFARSKVHEDEVFVPDLHSPDDALECAGQSRSIERGIPDVVRGAAKIRRAQHGGRVGTASTVEAVLLLKVPPDLAASQVGLEIVRPLFHGSQNAALVE